MHTTPADAGELARTIAARTRVRGRHPGHLPAVRLPRRRPRRAGRADPDVGVGAQNVHHELQGAYTGEISAPMLVGLADWVIVGHSERRRDAGRDRRADRPQARPGGRGRPAADPVRRRAARGTRGRRARTPSSDRQLARRPGRARSRRRSRRPAWSSPTSRSGRSGPAGTRAAHDAAAMAEAIRATLGRARLGRCRRRRPDPVRRQRHLGQHRRVPGRARDRRRARRRRLAQARRDGRDRGRAGLTAAARGAAA